MERTCPRGHPVTEDYLRACPACGAQVGGAVGANPSLAPEQPEVRAPRAMAFLMGAVMLTVFGLLLRAGAQQGAAEWFSYVLLAAAVSLAVVAVLDRIRRP